MGPSEWGPRETGPGSRGWPRETEGDRDFTRHNQTRNGPDDPHFATSQPISPNDFSRKAATYYLTLHRKNGGWKNPARSSKFHIKWGPALERACILDGLRLQEAT